MGIVFVSLPEYVLSSGCKARICFWPHPLPIEVWSEDGTAVDRVLYLSREQRESAKVLWLRVHEIRYPEQASLQINQGAWVGAICSINVSFVPRGDRNERSKPDGAGQLRCVPVGSANLQPGASRTFGRCSIESIPTFLIQIKILIHRKFLSPCNYRATGPHRLVYLIGHFHDLYSQSHVPEPVRLIIAVTKAFQATNPKLGPDDFSHGWRPDQGVDPRRVVSEKWRLIFNPLSWEVRRALTESLLSAWLNKTLQYPIAEYLPLPPLQHDYRARELFRDIGGGGVWNAAEKFHSAGVSDAVFDRLRNWGVDYTGRAARIQYQWRAYDRPCSRPPTRRSRIRPTPMPLTFIVVY